MNLIRAPLRSLILGARTDTGPIPVSAYLRTSSRCEPCACGLPRSCSRRTGLAWQTALHPLPQRSISLRLHAANLLHRPAFLSLDFRLSPYPCSQRILLAGLCLFAHPARYATSLILTANHVRSYLVVEWHLWMRLST